MKYRIRDIENFVEACSHPTIMRAARQLEISQPALTVSIRRLEADADAVFFFRSRTGIRLTSSGRQFLAKAQDVLAALRNLEASHPASDFFSGRIVSIGTHPTIAQYFLPTTLSVLRERAPDYRVELTHGLSRDIQAEVQRGNLDLGIVVNATRVPDLVIQSLTTDVVKVWIEPSLTSSDTVICDPHLVQTQSILRKWKHRPEKLIPTDSLELICRMVEKKLGFGIVPARTTKLLNCQFKCPSTLPTYRDEIAIVHRPEFGKAQHEKLVIEALRQAIR